MDNKTIDSTVEFTIQIPALEIKMTSNLSKEDALMILKKVIIAIGLVQCPCDYDDSDWEMDDSEVVQN